MTRQVWRGRWRITGGAGLLLMLVYLPILRSAFFVKDDIFLLTSAQMDFPESLLRPWLGGFYRPVSEWFFALEYAAFGMHPLPYHLVSVALHGLSCYLVFLLAKHVLGHASAAALASLIFAVHPLHTECVSWISGQMSLLSGLLGLAVLYHFVASSGLSARSLIVLFVLFVCGSAAYESFYAVPFMCAGLALLMGAREGSPGRRLLVVFALGAVCLAVRYAVIGASAGPYGVQFSLVGYVIDAAYYLYLLLGGTAAGGRILRYDPGLLQMPSRAIAVFTPVLLLTVGLLIVRFWPRGGGGWTRLHWLPRRETVGLAMCLLAALLPSLLVPGRPRRLAYLAVVPWSMLLAGLIGRVDGLRGRAVQALLVGLLVLSAVTLYSRNRDWRQVAHLEKMVYRELVELVQVCGCEELVVDVPNLIGDAMFFHTRSAEAWIRTEGGRTVHVDHTYNIGAKGEVRSPCVFRLPGEVGVAAPAAGTDAKYDQGHNWLYYVPKL